MDNYLMIKQCKSDEELEELARNAIDVYTKQAYRENAHSNYIGINLDINPTNFHLADKDFVSEYLFDEVTVWNGYLPLGMKIVYGGAYNKKYKTYTHGGCYYYLDDESYVLDFFKFIKNLEIEEEYDIIVAVHDYLKKLFGKQINARERSDINKLFYKTDYLFHRPVKEHSIKDFYGNGSALCTEYAAIGENLLSVMGLEVLYMYDKEHAYNIFAYSDQDKGIYVVDFAKWVECYDTSFHLIDTYPYFEEIKDATSQDVDDIVNAGKRIVLDDYYLYSINGMLYKVITVKKREYGVDFDLEEKKPLILKRKKDI